MTMTDRERRLHAELMELEAQAQKAWKYYRGLVAAEPPKYWGVYTPQQNEAYRKGIELDRRVDEAEIALFGHLCRELPPGPLYVA